MTKTRYAVDAVADDPALLRDQLDRIADEAGKIISIMWQPTREVAADEHGQRTHTALSGYVIVSEYEFPDSDAPKL